MTYRYPRRGHWILNGHELVECDLMTWARWLEANNEARHVAADYVGPMWVSTVFLGIDHNFSTKGPPLLFETMVFTDSEELEDITCRRYATWDEAERGHRVALRYARLLWKRAKLKPLTQAEEDRNG